ncbi:N-(5'-phosphoribosyl)anthranilate isomerase 1, chloroplastic isoform X2 [Physcomitrium patens]|uniref:N-(5'-phosphoribosyl)anthranilate isomerase 1, chloroplastic isoform X2 n=1 Tax=Physcomitrium patens TaxID=3218 RepID=UPI000D1594BB|nr:N-(5'-phosphoribosyl)anthranilate isomerase 1, chloroplastic-like isoform X2 [Physcomitrium patens]|eukprot:XP_024400671.1 N-(5'-phosphoribosyl)anthranilate isomerase 1, chloroplastic-like isoform X2 [Physcomitrella patens]
MVRRTSCLALFGGLEACFDVVCRLARGTQAGVAAPIVALQSSQISEGMAEGLNSKAVRPLIKMCGITSPEDAAVAARAGATYIGMIVWPKSKRSVTVSLAQEIAAAARENGAEPVGVFVDEDAEQIERACNDAKLGIAQLHGDGARASLLQGLPESLKVIYVLHANKNGIIQTKFPESSEGSPLVDWVLVDSLQGGSGEQFDWRNFRAPSMQSRRGWLLAGGLTPSNVATALSLVTPNAVDVSSGIAGPDGIRKDPARIQAFVHAVQNSDLFNDVGSR